LVTSSALNREEAMNPILVAAGTAALFSKRVRGVVRKGVVYGLAGALEIGDTVASAARGAAHEAEEKATGLRGKVSGAAQGVAHGAEAAVSTASGAAAGVVHGAEKVASSAADAATGVVHGAEQAVAAAGEMVEGLVEEAKALRAKPEPEKTKAPAAKPKSTKRTQARS
jgi:hypothetical protein